MDRDLYSELRTIYETTDADPHTFRITIKLKDLVDGETLRRAVDKTMERYPYFRVRLCREGDRLFLTDDPSPVPVLWTGGRIVLGSEETSGHLLAFCYWKNRLFIDAYHGLTDGGGIAPLIKTLLYYYCSAYYGRELSADGVTEVECGAFDARPAILEAEAPIVLKEISFDGEGLVAKKENRQ